MLRKATVYCILFLQFTQAFADCLMFVISAPSGVGKDTMADMLKEKYHQLQPVLSVTDRPIRTNEVDLLNGYKFVSTEEFNKMKKDGELLNPLVSY
jgi:guanylate kinase